MNPRVPRYLDKAKECERLAAQKRDPNTKAAFLSMSRYWRKLATQIEQSDYERSTFKIAHYRSVKVLDEIGARARLS